jgi:hypothetical protein
MRVDAKHAQQICAQRASRAPTAPRDTGRAARVAACLMLVAVVSRVALPASATATSIVLQAPLAIALDCVKDALKQNGYGLVPDNAGQPGAGPVNTKRAETLTGVRRLSADEVRRFAALGILKDREPHIDYGLARMSVTLIPVDARSTRIHLASSILVFMAPGIPLMRPSRLFWLSSDGELEADLLASLKRSSCTSSSAPSPASH